MKGIEMDIRAVVFDLDGTLIDSSRAIIDSLFTAVEYYRVKPSITRDDSYLFMGKSLKETLKIIMPDADEQTMLNVGKYYVKHYHEFQIKDAELFPYVKETIVGLRDRGVKLAVATAKHSDCALAELAATGIDVYFDQIRGTDEGMPSKPDPRLLLEICSKFGLAPKKVLMVGDTDRDVLFGRNAGCHTCAVGHGNWPRERFIRENVIPDFFLLDFRDLMDHVKGL